MSGTRSASMARTRGENRFYVSPGMRKQQQHQEQHPPPPPSPRQQHQHHHHHNHSHYQQKPQQKQQYQPKQVVSSKNCVAEAEKRVESSDCNSASSASCSVSGRAGDEISPTNLDRFLEHTTPLVTAQTFSKTSVRGWRNHELEPRSYFVLEDLWESFREWSAYGVGVPLLLNGSENVMQYYVPYLSGIQLYVDESRPSPRLSRRPGEESDAESSRETSSDGSDDYGAMGAVKNGAPVPHAQHSMTSDNIQSLNRLSVGNKSFSGSSDESEISSPPGRLVFEYMEHDPPFSRLPLIDQIENLAIQFPALNTYRSCELSPSSWISVAWYPIYRIPTGPTLQNLDAYFLTFHTLSTPFQSGQHADTIHVRGSNGSEGHYMDMSIKLPLPTFALVTHKFEVTFWNPSGVYECQKLKSLWRAAHSWLRRLQVYHPDYRWFLTHNTKLGEV